ncbi:MAG: hypothetical protein EXR74_06610 [Bdellovibrionales bacterium]|nr:hypothetical protein [Bdellovibrionales bacterium]
MHPESNHRLSLAWFLVAALILHIIFVKFPLTHSSLFSLPSTVAEQDPIEIERYPEEKRKPSVQTSRSQEEILNDQSVADLAGEFKNRIKKETQSRFTGPFQEGKSLGESAAKSAKGGHKNESDNLSNEGEPTDDFEGKVKGSELMVLGRSPHYLSDKIEKGDQTLLNTDKVLYASFINRIAEEVYEPWVGFIGDALKNIKVVGMKIDNNTYVTKLNVVMNKEGEVTGIRILSSCGIPVIDEAPKKAFWNSEPFPNPPSQLVEEDGYIRLVYEFHFEWKSSGFNIIPHHTI